MAGRGKVKNGKAAMDEGHSDVSVDPATTIIWTTMDQRVAHSNRDIHRTFEAQPACDAAHGQLLMPIAHQ